MFKCTCKSGFQSGRELFLSCPHDNRKAEQTENQQLFLDPPKNWGHRAKGYFNTWRVRYRQSQLPGAEAAARTSTERGKPKPSLANCRRLSANKFELKILVSGPVLGGSQSFESFSISWSVFTASRKYQRKFPYCFKQGKRVRSHAETRPEPLFFRARPAFGTNYFPRAEQTWQKVITNSRSLKPSRLS